MNCCKFRSWLLAAVAGLVMAPHVRAADPGFRKGWIVILHTNDLHGHFTSWRGWDGALKEKSIGGFSRVAAAVNQVLTDVGKNRVLLPDAGDTMIADPTKGHAMVEGIRECVGVTC